MTEHEFTLADRVQKIKSINEQYDLEHKAYIAFSGGKDSTVLHYLIDEALPNNKIPRVYANTGIELNSVRDFVLDFQKIDERIIVLQPKENIKSVLETYGYPFKSKKHSKVLANYQKNGLQNKYTRVYIGMEKTLHGMDCFRGCPEILKHQFQPDYKLRVSDICCEKLKEEPLSFYQKEHNRPIGIVGVRREEGGRRFNAQCTIFNRGGQKLLRFQPLAIITEDWENYFIRLKNIKLASVYYPPYNFERTGCKGCPFAPKLQKELDILNKYFPTEAKQCEIVWKPVYDEYRRIGYRLKEDKNEKSNRT